MHQAQSIGVPARRQALAQRHGALDSGAEEPGTDLFRRVEGPYPRANLRFGAVRRARERFPRRVLHGHRVARRQLAFDLLHRAGKDPGMAALEGFLPTLLELDHVGTSTSSWPADAPRRRPWRAPGNRDACRPAWWRCWRGRASPAPRAGPARTAARGWRTNGAACAGARARRGPGGAPTRRAARRPATARCAARARRRRAP